MKYETVFRRLNEAMGSQAGSLSRKLRHCKKVARGMAWRSSCRPRRAFRVRISDELESGRFIRIELQHREQVNGKSFLVQWSPWETRAVGFIDAQSYFPPSFVCRCETLGGERVIQGTSGYQDSQILADRVESWRQELLVA